ERDAPAAAAGCARARNYHERGQRGERDPRLRGRAVLHPRSRSRLPAGGAPAFHGVRRGRGKGDRNEAHGDRQRERGVREHGLLHPPRGPVDASHAVPWRPSVRGARRRARRLDRHGERHAGPPGNPSVHRDLAGIDPRSLDRLPRGRRRPGGTRKRARRGEGARAHRDRRAGRTRCPPQSAQRVRGAARARDRERPQLKLSRDIWLLSGAQVLFGCGFGLLSAVWPLYLRELGASAQEIGIVFGAGSLVAVLCFLPAGYLADRIGRQPVSTAAWLCAALGVATFVPLTDWHGAFVGSALYWSGTAGLPLIIAYVTSTTPRRELGRALGIVLGAYFAGNIIGAPIAGVIAASIGFRAAVAIAAVLLAGSAALTFGLRSVPPHVERGPFRPPRTFWILLGITPFAAMLSIVSLAFLPVYLREVAAIPLDRLG